MTGSRWERLAGPVAGAGSYDRAVCWRYELERGGERVSVLVEATAAAVADGVRNQVTLDAVASKGWTAIVPHLRMRHLPRRLLVTVQGVTVSEAGDDD